MRQNIQLAVVGGTETGQTGQGRPAAAPADAASHASMRQEISAVFEQVLGRAVSIEDDTDIVEDLGMDSLGVMNFVMAIEDYYDLSIPLDRIAQIQTVGDLIRAVQELRDGQDLRNGGAA
jgi:acyl carrier protein